MGFFQPLTVAASSRYRVPVVCAFLLLAVGLVFGQTVRYEFVNLDDNLSVYDDPQVRGGFSPQAVASAFLQSHAGSWAPLTYIAHMLDCQIYGLNAGGHHLTNVLLHAATVILLFLVLQRMTGQLWSSTLAAAIFAAHPLRAESVAWVTERKDVLSGLFFVLTLGAYLGYVRHPFSLVRYLAVMVSFALGLMAKPMLVTLPFVLLLLDYWPLGRLYGIKPRSSIASSAAAPLSVATKARSTIAVLWRLILEKVPLLAMVAVACVATVLAQGEALATNEYIGISCARGKRTDFVRRLSGPVLLSRGFGGPVSSSRPPFAVVAGLGGLCGSRGDHHGCASFPADAPLPVGRVVVVSRDAAAGDRVGAVRGSGGRRPLHVPATDRVSHCPGVGCGGARTVFAVSLPGVRLRFGRWCSPS